jgi:hypothetical protein
MRRSVFLLQVAVSVWLVHAEAVTRDNFLMRTTTGSMKSRRRPPTGRAWQMDPGKSSSRTIAEAAHLPPKSWRAAIILFRIEEVTR